MTQLEHGERISHGIKRMRNAEAYECGLRNAECGTGEDYKCACETPFYRDLIAFAAANALQFVRVQYSAVSVLAEVDTGGIRKGNRETVHRSRPAFPGSAFRNPHL
jgi:hypothetical protein